MKQTKTRGKTSFSLPVFIADTSSTTGEGLSGVTSASSGLVLEYRRQGQSSWTSVTPQAGKTLGSYLSGGIVADGPLNGAYEVDFPDAAFASAAGVEWVACRIRGVTNMLPVLIEVQLDVVDYQTDAFGAIKPTTAGRTLDVTATGAARIDLANVENQGSTLNLTGTTIKTATDVETDTQDIQNRLPSGLVDGRMASIAQVVGDKTGYKLASDGLFLVTAWAVEITGSITGNLVGDVTGEVAELGPNALSANSLDDQISLAVWNALTTATYVDQSFGDRLLISASNTRQVAVTGNGHVASVLHDAEPDSIPEDAFVSGAISARAIGTDAIDADALASSANTEIANAVGQLTAIVDLGTMIINDGTANARYSVSALQNGPSGAGGSTINVYPVSASTPERVAGTTITYYRDENRAVSVVTDFVLDALTLEFVVEDSDGTDLLVIADGSISKSNKTFTVTIGTTVTATISNYRWSLRDITSGSNSVIARGVLSVQEAASNG